MGGTFELRNVLMWRVFFEFFLAAVHWACSRKGEATRRKRGQRDARVSEGITGKR